MNVVLAASLPDLLRQVHRVAELLHELELRLEPIDVLFLRHEEIAQELFGAVIPFVATSHDVPIQLGDGRELDSQVVPQDFDGRGPDGELVELLQIRKTVEKE